MAGVKGKSGGPRKNAGGARPGAGRPRKEKAPPPPPPPIPESDTPLAFIKSVMNDPAQDLRIRLRAAIAAAQYEHTKKGDGGKKDEQAEKAKKAASKFSASAPPKLVVNNGR